MLKGAQQAAAEINENGGLLDQEVEIVAIDDAGDPATGVSAANEAIKDGLDGVVGPYNSGVGIETLPLYIEDGLVPVRLTSDHSTDGLGFTLQPMTYQIAPVASKAMTDWLGRRPSRSPTTRPRPTPRPKPSPSQRASKSGRRCRRLRASQARCQGILVRRRRKLAATDADVDLPGRPTSPRAA